MLAKNAKLMDINLEHWRRLTELAYVHQNARRITLLHEAGKPYLLQDSEKGELRLPEGQVDDGQAWAERLYRENPGVYEALVIDPSVLRDQLSKAQSDPAFERDVDEVARLIWEKSVDAPGLGRAPKREFTWHGVPFARIKRFADLILPEACIFVMAVFDAQGIWASLLVQLDQKKISYVGTFDALPAEELEGIVGRDQHPFLLSLVSNTFKRPSFGWFVEKDDFIAYMKEPDTDMKDEIFQRALVEKRATFDYSILIERSVKAFSPINPGLAAVQGRGGEEGA